MLSFHPDFPRAIDLSESEARLILILKLSRTVPLILLCACLPSAREQSLGFAYGPSNQLQLSVNRDLWGLYVQPILAFRSDPSRDEWEYGGRFGLQYHYTAFTYRKFECRAQLGAGMHLVRRTDEQVIQNIPDSYEQSQTGAEIWMQPEFRFYQRFAMLLEMHILRFVHESDGADRDFETITFQTPELSISKFRFGVRYYWPFGSQE